ncbi:YfhO family protein [Hazenella sp. IB182353]|uniref:YfhO family protein n=1 Tax=Polycladospora coralii TaxID=2771432 RepID=UPI0017468E1B|nr:YfhO family protein [Polycladospora coralii]MBS7532019.1 YfhO family protein [Polycladospora coralii]
MEVLKNKKLYILLIYIFFILASIGIHAHFLVRKIYFFEACCDSLMQVAHFYPFLQNEYLQGNFFWSWQYGLGGDIFSEFLYYFSTSPFFWTTMLLNATLSLQDIYDLRIWISIIKLVLCMIFMYHLLRYCKRTIFSSIIASLIYGGSVYFLFYSYRYDFMVDGMVWLPLLILGYERLIDSNKKGLFIFSVFIIITSNFYLAFISSVFLFLYATLKYFISKEVYSIVDYLKHYIKTGLYYGIGWLLSAFSFFPAVYAYLNVDRFYTENVLSVLFTWIEYQILFYKLFLITDQRNSMVIILPILVYFIFLMGFKLKNRDAKMRFRFTLFICVIAVSPLTYSFFNGFSSMQYRWLYLFIFVIAHISAYILDDLLERKTNSKIYYLILLAVLSGLLFFKAEMYDRVLNNDDYVIFTFGVLTCVVLLLISKLSTRFSSILLVGLVLLNITYTNINVSEKWLGDSITLKKPQEQLLSEYALPEDIKMFEDLQAKDNTFYRILWDDVPYYNSPMLYHYNGFGAYNSLLSGHINNMIKNEYNINQHNTPSLFKNLDHRLYLETGLANRYYVTTKDSDYIPYGYTMIDKNDKYRIYENQYSLPIGFMYDSIVTKSNFDKLNFGQRDQLFLRAGVVENGKNVELPTFNTQSLLVDSKVIKKEDMQLKNATIDGEILKTEKDAQVIISNPFKDREGEVLVSVEIKKRDGSKYVLKVNDNPFVFFGKKNIYNYPKEKIVINTGFDKKKDKLTIELSSGEYILKDIQITLNSYDNYGRVINQRAKSSLYNVAYTEQSVSGDINVDRDGLLFLSIPYSKGWKIKVDGVEKESLKVNTAFTGVVLNKGNHHIELDYTPPLLMEGAIVSFITLILLAATWLRNKKRISEVLNSFLNRDWVRFIIVGFINTFNYYVCYLFFLHVFHLNYLMSHLIAFVLSMIGSFLLNSYYTYRTKPTLKKALKFPLTYVVNVSVTTSSLYVLVDLLALDENISPLIASIIAIPFTFLISKKILVQKNDHQD